MNFNEMVAFVKNSKDTADDQVAARAAELYPHFTDVVDTYQKKGARVRAEKDGVTALFKLTAEDQTPEGTLILESWNPADAPSIWTAIDVQHDGTKEDPIPAVRGMEYVYGLYYIEEDKLYRCHRQGETEGGKVTLQYLPSELVGQYFVLVEKEEK